MKLGINAIFVLLLTGVFALSSCADKNISRTTGWKYNEKDYGGFDVPEDYEGQENGPGLILIEGGAFTFGRVEQDIMYDWNNVPRNVTIPSFYIDEFEISNIDYLEYLYWLNRVFVDYPQVGKDALPDTLVWRRRLAYNEPYVEYYFRHPAYKDYPVVGVSWKQADNYCIWRTDRVNEEILIKQKIAMPNPNQLNEENFNTDAYLAGLYEVQAGKRTLESKDPNKQGDPRRVRIEDGILLPKYELPTEAQWEYAALGLMGNSADERIFNRKLYPWNGHYVRNDTKNFRGEMMANFQRGRGDLMGVAGALNDNASIPAPVDSYWPNDYGLYCMAGNVSEWVRDVYRPISSLDVDEASPFRGNVFQVPLTDEEGQLADKDSLGRIRKRNQSIEETTLRWNYKRADNINYLDGDLESSIKEGDSWTDPNQAPGSERMYASGQGKADDPNYKMTTLVSDNSRVYKGGSWRDRVYWLGPATRRFLPQEEARDDIGFRCAMIRVGSPAGNNSR